MTLGEIQEASYARADLALRGSWPRERAMAVGALESFLAEHRYCVFATTTARGHAQARPVGFSVVDDAFWIATVAGGRLRSLRRTAWASLVVSDGEGDAHRAVAVDGPVTLHESPPAEVLEVWEQRFGSRAEWAAAWGELQAARLFSYDRA